MGGKEGKKDGYLRRKKGSHPAGPIGDVAKQAQGDKLLIAAGRRKGRKVALLAGGKKEGKKKRSEKRKII